MIKALIFDFDGVILESVDVKGWAFQKIFEGYPKQQEQILEYHYYHGGLPRFNKVRHILKEFLNLPYDDAAVLAYCEEFRELVFKKVLEAPFVPGAPEALKSFQGRYLTFIVSGTPHEEMNHIVDAKGLRAYFTSVYGSPVMKEEWTEKILSQYHLLPEQVVWVGDAASDWGAAVRYGIPFVLRSWSGNQDVFKSLNVNFKMDDLKGLPALVEQLNRKKT